MKPLSFNGSGSEYFKIWIVNILLVIVTLGLYYPWAKVRNYRYFYGNSSLNDRSFDYHATGRQLFIGYLIAMALFLVYIIVEQLVPLGAPVLLLVLFLAIPWIIWRSLMFTMRMTSFSNVRFSFAGKLGTAYINFFLLPLLFFICIYALPVGAAVLLPMYQAAGGEVPAYVGILLFVAAVLSIPLAFYFFALMQKKNTSYLINGSRYGQGEFSTELKTWSFAKIALKTFGLNILVFFVVMFLIGLAVAAVGMGFENLAQLGSMDNPEEIMMQLFASSGVVIAIILGYITMIAAFFFIMAYMQTRQRAYVYENTLLNERIAFASTLRARSLAWVMISNLLLIICTAGLAAPWAKVRIARLMLENTFVDAEGGFDEYITQQQKEQSSLGEQVGDAFDVDVGIAI
ncbi:YjgN family protein [Eionea flava]